MPTFADLTAAVPKCPRITKRFKHPDRRCGTPMTYREPSNLWHCPVASCGMEIKGLLLAEYTAEAEAGLREAA